MNNPTTPWKSIWLTLIFILTFFFNPLAQTIPVGSGSYTTVFPGTDAAGRNTFPSGSPQLSGAAGTKPVPTNDWYSNMIKVDHGGQAFNYPLSYKSLTSGLVINYTVPPAAGPTEYRQPMGDVNGIVMGVDGLSASQSTASDHSDWAVTMTWAGSGKTFNATMGIGMPFTYFTKGTSDVAKVSVNHNPAGATVSGNKIIITNNYNGANFVIFGPAGTVWSGSGGQYTSSLNGKNYWSMAMLPPGADVNSAIAALEPHAFVFPGNTLSDYNYNEATGTVTTTFTITPDVKEGGNNTFVQGLLPHQWSRLASGSSQPTGMSYPTVRGELKLLHGNTFSVANKFAGILPTLPDLGKYSSGFDPGALYQKIEAIKNDGLAEWTDSYNEGQAMNRLIQVAHLADQIGHTEARDQLVNTVKNRLEDWFKAEGGEVAFLFYYNDTWKTMIGYPAGHRQDQNLNDHHFHWGYFIHAAAAIEQYQPGWAAQWGGMVDLLIRDASNPSRTDAMFPFMRNFSPFAGHCWANGFATEPFGNDQESTSESMQFNSSLIHWGSVTGNDAIRDLGIYLYTTEQSAIEEYWFDQNDRTFQPEYQHEMVARIWGGGYDNGTWWTQDIAASYGIQLYPIHGGALYMGHNTAYVQEVWNGMTSKTDVLNNVSNDNLWYDTYWSFLSFSDPALAISLYDAYPDRNIKFGISDAQTYHWLHTMNAMGQVMEEVTADYPISAVFNKNGVKTYVAHNYGSNSITVHFSDGFSLNVPGGTMVTNRDITPTATISASASEIPANGSVTLNASTSGSGITKVEFYRGNLLIGTDTSAPYSATDNNVPASLVNYYAKVYVGTSLNVSNIVRVQVGSQLPYTGTPAAIPGTVEAGYYDSFEGGSGQGIAYSDATPWNEGDFRQSEAVDAGSTASEGFTVGWIDAGEWLEYTVNVAQAGNYNVKIRYTSGSASGGGPFWFEREDGTKISEDITVAMNDASWTTYTNKDITGVALGAGTQVIRVRAGNGGFNLGRMTFEYDGTPTPVLTTIVVSPANASIAQNDTQQFTAQGYDQNGDPIAMTPVWSTNGGSINGSGLYTGSAVGNFTVTASASGVSGSASVSVSNQAPVLTSITVSPSSASIGQNTTQQFTAQGFDQNGNTMSVSPTWTANGGSINGSGLYTGSSVGSFTVTASAQGVSGTASITVTGGGGTSCSFQASTGDYTAEVSSDSPNPTITFIPSVSGVGDNVTILYYGTSPTGGYPGYIVSPNAPYQINAAAGQTIYFYYTYSLPQGGENNTSASRHSFEVGNCGGGGTPTPVLTTITVSPASVTLELNDTQQFSAQGFDQNGNPMSMSPTWSATGGSINASGLYTANSAGSFTVTASSQGVSGNATVTVNASSGGGCTFVASTGDYTAEVSSDASNPTITFVPSVSGVGNNVTILYYSTSPTGNYPGYMVSPNTPYQINAAAGQTIYFYYTYSLPQGGENNTSATRHNFVVGNCSSGARWAPESTASQAISDVMIYPNPVNDMVMISGLSEAGELELVDVSGRVCQKWLINTTDGRQQLDLKHLAPGTYLLRIISSQPKTLRLLKE